jgi:predicted transcriptional regulator
MATQKVTVELPQAIFQQLARIASATQQPLEVLAAQSIVSNLPPTPDNAPVEIQAELLQMQTWDSQELLELARSQTTPEQQQRHIELLEKNQNGELTHSERTELSELRIAADRLMLQKAYAWSVLRWRGHRVPALNELPE